MKIRTLCKRTQRRMVWRRWVHYKHPLLGHIRYLPAAPTGEQRERDRMRDIKRRTPFHLQRGHRQRVFVAWGGKVLAEASPQEIAELNAYEDRKGTPP